MVGATSLVSFVCCFGSEEVGFGSVLEVVFSVFGLASEAGCHSLIGHVEVQDLDCSVSDHDSGT